jgi:hypothetical protein
MRPHGDFGFDFRTRRNGDVEILRDGRLVATLRGRKAQAFLTQVDTLPAGSRQQLMARLTGNYKRGTERRAAAHPRNRRDAPK